MAYTIAQLRKALAKGAKIVTDDPAYKGYEFEYSPRGKGDREPWQAKGLTGVDRVPTRRCEIQWGPAGEPVELTEDQKYILKCLAERNNGVWHPGAGWHWTSRSETVRRLSSLVKKGLVVQTCDEEYKERFEITDKGRGLFESYGNSPYLLMYRKGAVITKTR